MRGGPSAGRPSRAGAAFAPDEFAAADSAADSGPYVIGGLKLTPIRPTYVQARDAIIAASGASDRFDLEPAWRGFAKRGLGDGAVAPPSGSTDLHGVIESFTLPPGLVDESDFPPLHELEAPLL